jgi:hypothetical protein
MNKAQILAIYDSIIKRPPHIVAFGGGVDSTAMILGLHEKGLPIDLILFADTGGERPETYAHIENFSKWLVDNGLPSITIVKRTRKDGSLETLEQECHRRNNLPSIAYGFKSCSQKHKIAPQDKFLNSWQRAIDWWKTGSKCVKYIGYDAGESHRADNAAKRDDPKYTYKYPLIEWQWEREDCLKIVAKYGFKVGKSACFFCPSSRPKEIIDLHEKHPDLAQRALDIEKQANLTTIKGLGRNYAWSDVIRMHKAQIELPFVGFDLPCDCTE